MSLPVVEPRTDLYDPAEHWSVDELRAHQLERLCWSLAHAYDNVPQHRRAFDAAGFDPRAVQSLADPGRRYVPGAATSLVALGVFDATRVSGPITLARSNGGERFEPLGGRETQLPAGVLVVQDGVRVLSLFAQRDGVHQAVTAETEDLLVLACVVPGVAHVAAEQAVQMFVEEVSC